MVEIGELRYLERVSVINDFGCRVYGSSNLEANAKLVLDAFAQLTTAGEPYLPSMYPETEQKLHQRRDVPSPTQLPADIFAGQVSVMLENFEGTSFVVENGASDFIWNDLHHGDFGCLFFCDSLFDEFRLATLCQPFL